MQRTVREARVVHAGEHDDLDAWIARANSVEADETVHSGHAEIQDDHVHVGPREQPEHLFAGPGGPDDVDLIVLLKTDGQRLEHESVIICEKDFQLRHRANSIPLRKGEVS